MLGAARGAGPCSVCTWAVVWMQRWSRPDRQPEMCLWSVLGLSVTKKNGLARGDKGREHVHFAPGPRLLSKHSTGTNASGTEQRTTNATRRKETGKMRGRAPPGGEEP
jgi:hypothetical protein